MVRRIIAIGDSITAHCSRDLVFGGLPPRSWVEWIALDTGASLQLYAKPGADSAEILDLVAAAMTRADLVFVIAGVNNTLSWRRFRRVDLRSTLGDLIERAKSTSGRVVVVQIPESLGSRAYSLLPYGPRLRGRIAANRLVVAEVAESHRVQVVEPPELAGDRIWIDGVHPTSTGHFETTRSLAASLDLLSQLDQWILPSTREDIASWCAKAVARFAVKAPLLGSAG